MSKLNQELKVLLYLNQRCKRTEWIKIGEIADYLEVSHRQARRYLEDLNNINDIEVRTKHGRDGGYRLVTPLDKGFAMPENIVLAMSIAMKKNDKIEKVLSELPNYVIADSIAGDNEIDDDMLNNLEKLINAIGSQKEIIFQYKDFDNRLYVQPYKIVLTNHTYYLLGVYKDKLKIYNVRLISNIDILGSFKPSNNFVSEIQDRLSRYGIKDGKITTLRVRCKDVDTLKLFDNYYEGKGNIDLENLVFEVKGNSENELYYPLFRIKTEKYVFLDEDFKNNYLRYLNNVIRSIKNGKEI